MNIKDPLFIKRRKELEKLLALDDATSQIIDFFKRFKDLDDLSCKVILWGHVFMPEYFTSKTPDFHFDIIKSFFSNKNEYNAYPRGFGKTTVIQLCISCSCAIGLDTFIVLLEKSRDEADEVLEAVRETFKQPQVIKVYGELCKVSPTGHKKDKLRDREGDFFINGVRLRGRGFDKNVRGLKSFQHRPSRIIGDDVESDEHIESPDMRKKYLNNYLRGVIPAAANGIGYIKFFGTILHDDSLLNSLISNHDGIIRRAWEGDDRKLLWPDFWTAKRLEEKRMQMRIEGKGDSAFYQEYFNEPVSEEDQVFHKNMFSYYNEYQLKEVLEKPYQTYILVDPAISKKTSADFTAIVCLLLTRKGEIYIVDIVRERLNPTETIVALFDMYERWNPIKVGIEQVAYQKALAHFVEEKKREQDSVVKSMQVVEIKAENDKESKIKGLVHDYSLRRIYHNENDPMTPVLEAELLRFPKGATDDIIDAIAGLHQIAYPLRKKPVQEQYKKHLRRPTYRRVAY